MPADCDVKSFFLFPHKFRRAAHPPHETANTPALMNSTTDTSPSAAILALVPMMLVVLWLFCL